MTCLNVSGRHSGLVSFNTASAVILPVYPAYSTLTVQISKTHATQSNLGVYLGSKQPKKGNDTRSLRILGGSMYHQGVVHVSLLSLSNEGTNLVSEWGTARAVPAPSRAHPGSNRGPIRVQSTKRKSIQIEETRLRC